MPAAGRARTACSSTAASAYTWEHDLHFLLKRAKAGDALFGNAVHHRARLARMLGLVAPSDQHGEAAA